jgi:hypothetical protein
MHLEPLQYPQIFVHLTGFSSFETKNDKGLGQWDWGTTTMLCLAKNHCTGKSALAGTLS